MPKDNLIFGLAVLNFKGSVRTSHLVSENTVDTNLEVMVVEKDFMTVSGNVGN